MSLRQADHSSRGVVPGVVCLKVIEEPHRGNLGPLGLSSHKQDLYIAHCDFSFCHTRYWQLPRNKVLALKAWLGILYLLMKFVEKGYRYSQKRVCHISLVPFVRYSVYKNPRATFLQSCDQIKYRDTHKSVSYDGINRLHKTRLHFS